MKSHDEEGFAFRSLALSLSLLLLVLLLFLDRLDPTKLRSGLGLGVQLILLRWGLMESLTF